MFCCSAKGSCFQMSHKCIMRGVSLFNISHIVVTHMGAKSLQRLRRVLTGTCNVLSQEVVRGGRASICSGLEGRGARPLPAAVCRQRRGGSPRRYRVQASQRRRRGRLWPRGRRGRARRGRRREEARQRQGHGRCAGRQAPCGGPQGQGFAGPGARGCAGAHSAAQRLAAGVRPAASGARWPRAGDGRAAGSGAARGAAVGGAARAPHTGGRGCCGGAGDPTVVDPNPYPQSGAAVGGAAGVRSAGAEAAAAA